MISKNRKYLQQFCREPIENIENYEIAVTSHERYELHHRDEVKILPSGIKVERSRQYLIENGRYYHCPANELIFLSTTEHRRLHQSWKKTYFFGKGLFGEANGMFGKTSVFKDSFRDDVTGEKNGMFGKVGSKNPLWKGDNVSEKRKRQRNAPSHQPEYRRAMRLKKRLAAEATSL